MNLWKHLLTLGLPVLWSKLSGTRTYILAVALVGVAAFCSFAGYLSVAEGIVAALGGAGLATVRLAIADMKQAAQAVKPGVLALDKLLEKFGYADLDVLFAKLEKFLEGGQ